MIKNNFFFIFGKIIKEYIFVNIVNKNPPDLDQIFKLIQDKVFGIFTNTNTNTNGNKSKYVNSKGFLGAADSIFFIIAVLYVIVGFYIIKPAEQGVVTRFGKYNRTVSQGPHWLPYFIENKVVVNSEKLERSSHGASMLTRDENIVTVEIEVQYIINNVREYLFELIDPCLSLREASESALRQVIGHSNLDYVVTSGKEEIASAIYYQLQSILNSYKSGIHVSAVALKEARVPIDVKSSFDDVIKAQEEREQLKHQAESFANKIIPEAKGRAIQMLEEAEAFKLESILKAEGDTMKFKLILPEYLKAPEITRKRLYLDTIEYVLSKTTKILIDSNSGNNILYLPIDKIANSNVCYSENKDKLSNNSSFGLSDNFAVRNNRVSDKRKNVATFDNDLKYEQKRRRVVN